MASAAHDPLVRDLRALLGAEAVLDGVPAHYLHDATESHGLRGRASAVVVPERAEQVAAAVRFCHERGVAVVPRGGGTGYAGGAVPLEGEVVVSLERLDRVRSLDTLQWRMHVEAGVTTARVQRLARENGLAFPPDPGAAESSQIGGNIATNAGGPHAFKYGVTGRWVMGLEAVVAPGELIEVGGAVRKDVAGYDLRSLLVGSEGTLGIVTAAWLRLIPAPERRHPLVGFYPSTAAGCAAIEAAMGSGVVPAAIEFVDGDALAIMDATGHTLGASGHGFAVIVEADGYGSEAGEARNALWEALIIGASELVAPERDDDSAAVWEWRRTVSHAVVAWRGGKIGEDVAVPVDRLADVVVATAEIGRRHDLPTCSYGHAGDGNVHASLLVGRDDADGHRRARAACEELFALAVELGGTVSGEHGVGVFKNGQLRRQWPPRAVALHRAVKTAFDPQNLFNPGKKLA